MNGKYCSHSFTMIRYWLLFVRVAVDLLSSRLVSASAVQKIWTVHR